MIRGLIKLGTVALAGYAVYSLYELIANRATGQSQSKPFASRQSRPENIPDFGTEVGGTRMTGGGRGQSHVTQEAAGTMASHRVGRGVIHR